MTCGFDLYLKQTETLPVRPKFSLHLKVAEGSVSETHLICCVFSVMEN